MKRKKIQKIRDKVYILSSVILFFCEQKLASNEVGQLLWYVFTHATADALRITALLVGGTALTHGLTKYL